MNRRSLATLITALVLPALAACSQSQSRQLVENAPETGGYPARLPLANIALPVEVAPVQPEGAQWQAAGPGAVHFGVPGQGDLLALRCAGTGLEVVRRARAEEGAKALFALIGNGRIARLPLNVALAGEDGEWRATLPLDDVRLDVLKGGNRIEATLPGGGTLKLPASGEPGRLLASCRAAAGAAA